MEKSYRNYEREYGDSPAFLWQNASITDNNQVNVSWETEDPNSRKYLPFNLTRIINNSSVGIYFYPNQDTSNPIPVLAGTILTIDRSTLPAVRSFAIARMSATTINAGEIIVTNSREGQTTNSIVGRLHERLFNRKPRGVL